MMSNLLLLLLRYPREEGETEEEWDVRIKDLMANAPWANLLKWILRAAQVRVVDVNVKASHNHRTHLAARLLVRMHADTI